MNKKELIESIASKAKLTKTASEDALNAFIETVGEELVAGNKVSLQGFGTFETRVRKARPEREGINPSTKEPMIIPAQPQKNAPCFKAGKQLRDSVNQ